MKKAILLLIFLLIPLASALEYGTDSADQSWTTITFDQSFATRPVVFTQVNSDNDVDFTVTRLRGVNTNQFQVRLQETTYDDGVHASEDLAWLAVEVNEVGIARSVRLRQNDPSFFRPFNIFNGFSSTPYFFSQMQAFRNGQPTQTDVRNISDAGFEMRLEETSDMNGIHPREVVGFLAFEDFQDAEYDKVNVNTTWTSVSFSETYASVPSVLASVNSENEGDTVSVVVRDVTETGFEIKLLEDPGFDGTHLAEDVSYLVLGEVAESLNVAIVDTGSSGISYIESALQGEGHSTTLISFSNVASDLDSSYDLIVYPGGQTGVDAVLYNQYPGMIDAIQDFVDDGGDYIGICGGAIVGSDGFVYNGLDVTGYTYQLDLLDVEATWYSDWSYYVGNMANLNFNVVMVHDVLDDALGAIGLDYAGGPTLSSGSVDIVVEYDDELVAVGYDLTGEGALAVGSYGAGQVVLSSFHPEYNDQDILIGFVDWVSL